MRLPICRNLHNGQHLWSDISVWWNDGLGIEGALGQQRRWLYLTRHPRLKLGIFSNKARKSTEEAVHLYSRVCLFFFPSSIFTWSSIDILSSWNLISDECNRVKTIPEISSPELWDLLKYSGHAGVDYINYARSQVTDRTFFHPIEPRKWKPCELHQHAITKYCPLEKKPGAA